jgi:hypothetical protein
MNEIIPLFPYMPLCRALCRYFFSGLIHFVRHERTLAAVP